MSEAEPKPSSGRSPLIRRAPRGPWRRWLKNFALTLLVLIGLTLVIRLGWGWYADRALRQAIHDLRAAGVPVRLEDFQPAAVPDEQNAALILREVFRRIDPIHGEQADAVLALEDLDDPDAIRGRADEVDAALAGLKPAFDLVEQASRRPACAWPVALTHPLINAPSPDLKPLRQLAGLLRVRALRAAQRGAGDEAVRAIEQQQFLARCASREHGSLLSLLVAESIEATAALTLEDVLPLLRVEPPQRVAGAVPRARLEALMRGLLDEGWLEAIWRRAIDFERLLLIDSVRGLRDGSLGTVGPAGWLRSPAGWLFAPMFKLDAVWAFDLYSRLAEAGTRPSWAEALAVAPAYPSFSNPFQRFAHLLTSILYPAHERVLRLHFRTRTLRRLAATAIAVRLAEVQRGQRPASLTELVPAYLEAIPPDPYADPPHALRYAPDRMPAVLYSVNVDGRDDGGRFRRKRDGTIDLDVLDLVWFLDGGRSRAASPATKPATPASGQAADHDPDEERQPREPAQKQHRQQQPDRRQGHDRGREPGRIVPQVPAESDHALQDQRRQPEGQPQTQQERHDAGQAGGRRLDPHHPHG